MTRKLRKLVSILGIGSVCLFSAGSCDLAASSFLEGVDPGLIAGLGQQLMQYADPGFADPCAEPGVCDDPGLPPEPGPEPCPGPEPMHGFGHVDVNWELH